MDLREEILKEHSRRQALKIAAWIGRDKKRFRRLVDLFLHDDYRVVQRSGYPLSIVADNHPGLAEENIHLLVKRLYDKGTHPAVRRNVMRILQFVNIPKKLHAEVINFCFQYLGDPKEAIAVKCFSITTLVRMVKLYPELKNEAELLIRQNMKGSMGTKVRVRRAMKEMENL